jgi:hypothetical protein
MWAVPSAGHQGIDGEPLRARYLVPTAGAHNSPHREANRGAAMKTTRLLILMRDQLGRFMRVRAPKPQPARRRRAVRRPRAQAVQLALF